MINSSYDLLSITFSTIYIHFFIQSTKDQSIESLYF